MNKKIAVVIPCYKVSAHIQNVILDIPDFVSHIIVVDDACPENSGKIAESLKINNAPNSEKLSVVYHAHNQGAGAAVATGYQKALALGAEIIVKIDGDGQMDSQYMKALITPLEHGFDYAKGNRFIHFDTLEKMPKIRLIGNALLSFMLKAASGYWFISDVANGYRAITANALKTINLNKMDSGYFFDLDMIIQLGIRRFCIKEVAMPSIYGNEVSSMSLFKVLVSFPSKIFQRFCKRLMLHYFVYNFDMASVYLLLGLPMVIWGTLFGAYRWYLGINEAVVNNTGVVMLAILPLIIGIQFLVQAISIDINNTPKK